MRVLSRFVYRAPLLPVATLAARPSLDGPLARLALAIAGAPPAVQATYARRAAFRATPHGLWAGVGVGTLGVRTKARTGPMRAAVTVSYGALWAAARARLDDEAARAEARLRVAPSLVRDETTARWLAFGLDGDGTEAVEGVAEVDELLADLLARAADWVAWDELRDDVGVDDDLLLTLVDDGLLVHDGAPPLVGPPPLEWMAARDPHWAEVAAALATPTLESLAAADGAELHAVLVHEGPVTLARSAVERAAALAPLLFRLQEALAPPMAERALDPGVAEALAAAGEIFGEGAFDLGALALGHYGTPLDVGEPGAPPPADAAVQRAVVDALVTALARGETEVALDADALAALAPDVATPPTFELMLAPVRERRGARPGDGWLLGLHAPAGASWGRFAHAVGTPLALALGELAAAEEGATATVDVAYAPSPRLGDLAAHPPVRAAALALSGWPAGDAVTPAELAVALPEGTLQRDEEAIAPSPLWRVRSTTAPRGLHRLLTGAALTRQHAPWALHLGALADLAYVPRLTLDGFVVAPASWRVPALPDRAALGRWRRAFGVPAAVQVGHEDELMLVDLEARDALDTLAKRGGDGARAWEVWPPLDALVDAGGRRLEAVVAVVDDAPAPPTVRAPVAPPRHAGPASGWHTFKLFGAADRADRVLAGALGPLLAGADDLADRWFFLRYVDGPGRRDHLRLRVRTGDVTAFAARLDEALEPARAAGDVVAIERAEYFREYARYGADTMDAVEAVFASDSALVLDLLSSGGEGDGEAALDELLVQSYDALAAGAGLDAQARLELARRRRHAYGLGRDDALAAAYRARQKSLRAALATPSPPFVAHRTRVAAALAPLSPARRASLLPPLLHLAAVRLAGVDAAREAAAFYLWERTRESLLRHAER